MMSDSCTKLSQKDTSDEDMKKLAKVYQDSIAKELHGICGEVLVSRDQYYEVCCFCIPTNSSFYTIDYSHHCWYFKSTDCE
jgi:hypothetical protein